MQNDSIDNLRLDLNKERVRGVIYVRAGDTKARTIHITLVNNGTVVDLSDAVFCELLIKKPDDKECDQTMVRYGNELRYTFRTQDINVPGECKCMVEVTFKDGTIVTSPEFAVMVFDKVIDPHHEESMNEYKAIQDILVEVTDLKKSSEDAADRAETAESNVSTMEAETKNYRDEAEEIAQGLEGVLMPQGTITFADLDDVQMIHGFLWKISDSFTTDDRFAEGSGHPMAAGTSVYITINNKFACMTGDAPTLGTAAAKDYTETVSELSEELITSRAVKSAIDTAISSLYKPSGGKTAAELISSLLIEENLGNVYNATTTGTTTSDFVEGAGKPIHIGDNVAIVDAGGGTYKFDLLAGFVDLSNYYTKSEVDSLISSITDVLGYPYDPS